MARDTVIRVTLYGKPGCCLCDEARQAVGAVRDEHPFELEEVDISLDPVLHRHYGERVPVLCVDGREAFELGVDAAALRDLLSDLDGGSRAPRPPAPAGRSKVVT